ncbi:hypothetical protein Acr_18g0010510 [Actinidia rufa]|uniref:CCHC-type domain-containing protein n=1 Tax=Actinidia rufa TaxID=165716 RepID=A0A7J0G7X8_9ERIC|nr:hypothetical protein Acr_18g0010510 [Actinidia rufa]
MMTWHDHMGVCDPDVLEVLSPAHLDESKPTWMSPSPVAKPKPDWSSYGVCPCDGCSSRRYGAPAPNRVGNGVRTRPHAPFEDRRVRLVSATRPGRSHALPRARGRTHAPTCAREEAARAATREEECPRALTRRAEAITRSHSPSRAEKGESTRGSRAKPRHAPGRRHAAPRARPVSADSAAMSAGWRTSYFCKDLHDPLENKGEKPEAKKDEEWRKMNRKTIGLIRQCIGHEVFHHVAQETNAYDLWIKLEEMYQAKTSRNKALLMRRLVNLKLQRETTVAEHTSEFQSLVNQLTSVDLQFDDEINSAPNGKLTTSMVMDALFNEEARRREMGSTDQSESQALVSEGSKERGRGQGRGLHRGIGKGRWRSQARGRTVRCFYCDQEGHIKRDCPKYKVHIQSSDTAATAVKQNLELRIETKQNEQLRFSELMYMKNGVLVRCPEIRTSSFHVKDTGSISIKDRY